MKHSLGINITTLALLSVIAMGNIASAQERQTNAQEKQTNGDAAPRQGNGDPHSQGKAVVDHNLENKKVIGDAVDAINNDRALTSQVRGLVLAADKVGVANLLIARGAPKDLKIIQFSQRPDLNAHIGHLTGGPQAIWVQISVVKYCAGGGLGYYPCGVVTYWSWVD